VFSEVLKSRDLPQNILVSLHQSGLSIQSIPQWMTPYL
jgi:hypothetical protein